MLFHLTSTEKEMSSMEKKKEKNEDFERKVEQFELKWRKKLAELAILLFLSYRKDGAHAYELRTRVEEILFSKRKEAKKMLEEVKTLLQKIVLLQAISYEERVEKIDTIKRQLELFPFLINNKFIQSLLDKEPSIPLSDSIDYLNELIELIDQTIDAIESSSMLWSNISGIYPSINSLEKSGFIALKRTEEHEGRLRKIYVITNIGRRALQKTISSILEIIRFMFQMVIEGWYEEKDIMASSAPLIYGKLFKKFREGIVGQNFGSITSFQQPHLVRPLLSFLIPPELNAMVPHTGALLSAQQLEQLLSQINDDVQRELVISTMKSRLEGIQNIINEVLKVLDTLSNKANK